MVGRIGGTNGAHHTSAQHESKAPDMDIAVVEVHAVAAQTQQASEEERHLPAEKARQMTDSMNKFLESVNTQLRFQMHDELKEYYVTIVDSKTDEVVREIPSKKLMDVYAAMKEFVGLLIDRKI